MAMFPKRAGRFMKALLSSLNASTFTPVSAITDPLVSSEDVNNVDSTVKILADMEYIEVQANADGTKSLRLTPSGVNHLSVSFGGVK